MREALASYTQAIVLFEAVRAEAGGETTHASFIAQWGEVYDQIIRLQLRQDEATWPPPFSRPKKRARALLDSLATGHIELFDDAAAVLLADETEAYAVRLSAEDAFGAGEGAHSRVTRNW